MANNQSFVNTGFPEFLEDSVKELTSTMEWMKTREMRLAGSVAELMFFIDEAIAAGICALDLETTGLNTRVRNGKPIESIVGFCLSYDPKVGIYVPVGHREGAEMNLSLDKVLDEIKRLWTNCVCIFHNSKFDMNFLKNYGVYLPQFDKFEDTLILARLYDAGQKEIGLKHLSEKLLNQPMLELDDVCKNTKRLDCVSPKLAYIYGASDGICTLDLYNFFTAADIIKQQRPIYNLEKRVVSVVISMENNLFKIDVPKLQGLKVSITAELEKIRKEIYDTVGREFNISSTQQLGKILFDELGYIYPSEEKTKSGQYSTNDAVLEKISGKYPMVKKVMAYRGLEKSLGTYIENLLNNHDEQDCVKLSFNQSGTDTGRFSSPGGRGINVDGYSATNVQSLPTNYDEGDPDVRGCFIARLGYKIVAIDYSGEELRVAANLSKEPKWLEEFLHGSADLHTATAKAIFKKEKVEKAERQLAKTVNFLVMYGGGSRGLAVQAGISENEAKNALDSFFKGLPVLKRWIDIERAKARKRKYSITAMGRIRPLGMFYDSGDRGQEAHGDRCAVNHEIQGSSADIMKMAMVRVSNWINANNFQDDIRLLITMHDEIVYEILEDKLNIYIPKIYEIMRLTDILQGILKWPVPLEMDVEYGNSWHVDHNFFEEHPELKNSEKKIEFHSVNPIVIDTTLKDEKPAEVTTPEASPEVPISGPEKVSETEVIIDEKMVVSTPEIPQAIVVENTSDTPPAVPEIVSRFDLLKENSSENVLKTVEVNSSGLTDSTANQQDAIVGEKNEEILRNHLTSGDSFVYILRDTKKSTLRRLNEIIIFMMDEQKTQSKYDGPQKVLKIVDREGHSLMVSELKVCVDGFLALARYQGI